MSRSMRSVNVFTPKTRGQSGGALESCIFLTPALQITVRNRIDLQKLDNLYLKCLLSTPNVEHCLP